MCSEVGCAPGDVSVGVVCVSGVRECHVKNKVLGRSGEGVVNVGQMGDMERDCDRVNNLTDIYGRVSRGPSPDTSPKRCLLSRSDWLQ